MFSKGAFSEILESQRGTEGLVHISKCTGAESLEISDILFSIDQHVRLNYLGREFPVGTPIPTMVTLEKMKQVCVL